MLRHVNLALCNIIGHYTLCVLVLALQPGFFNDNIQLNIDFIFYQSACFFPVLYFKIPK